MPENLTIGLFAFGAVLILISLLGGGFKVFTFVVSSTVSNPFIRIVAFMLGTGAMLLALIPDVISHAETGLPYTAVSGQSFSLQVSPSATLNFPEPTQTPLLLTAMTLPAAIVDTPTPIQPDPTAFVVSYWQNINEGHFDNSWKQ